MDTGAGAWSGPVPGGADVSRAAPAWEREIDGVGTLRSDGTLQLSPCCAVACGHHLIEGADLGQSAEAARARVRAAAQAAADELAMPVRVTTGWDRRRLWVVHESRPAREAASSEPR